MKVNKTLIATSIIALVGLAGCSEPVKETSTVAEKAPMDAKKSSMTEQKAPKVTADTYIHAEVDGRMATFQERAGGINKFYLFPRPTPTDNQPVVRMNRDTMYGGATIDTSEGASITIPEIPDDRYFSVMIIDNDHYTVDVLTEPGTHVIPKGTTKYVFAVPRVQIFDINDEAEIAKVLGLLKQFKIEAQSAEPHNPSWDWDSMFALRAEYEKEFVKFEQYPADWQETKSSGKVNEQTRHLGVAGAWGLFPEWESAYINYNKGQSADKCYSSSYEVPENNAFWSITVYGKDAFMKSDNVTLNPSSTTYNDDGSFTVYYGSEEACGEQANRLDITEGWNYLMRIYRPGQSVLDREYTLPRAEVFTPE